MPLAYHRTLRTTEGKGPVSVTTMMRESPAKSLILRS